MQTNDSLLNSLLEIECPDSTARIFPALVYDKAEGSIVVDADSNKYIDLSAGFAALPLGHNHPAVKNAVIDYLSNNGVMHGLGDVYSSRSKSEYIKTLKSFLPEGFNKIALSITGGQAVEMAIKTAIMHTKKPGVVSLKQGYHGLDLGAMALTGMDKFREPFIGFNSHPSISYIESSCEISVLEDLVKKMVSKGTEIGQILVEPVLGRYGNKKHKEGWLKELYSFTQKNNMLLIFDEVFTGLGRTGKVFRATDDKCDIICMGKAIGGGMPVSAIACSDKVMNSWPESTGEAIHTGTFFGHPLSCLTGLKTLEQVRKLDLVRRSKELGKKAFSKLASALSDLGHVKEVRGEGLMIAVEFTGDLMGVKMMSSLKEKGVILIPSGEGGRAISITPALNIPEDLFDKALDQIIDSAKDLTK